MRRAPVSAWLLVGLFFFAGLGFAVWEETRWIGLGQIWIAVAVVMALVFIGAPGKIGEKLGRGRNGDGGA